MRSPRGRGSVADRTRGSALDQRKRCDCGNGRAEGVGFEPTVSCPTHAFQACRFGRSRTPPGSTRLPRGARGIGRAIPDREEHRDGLVQSERDVRSDDGGEVAIAYAAGPIALSRPARFTPSVFTGARGNRPRSRASRDRRPSRRRSPRTGPRSSAPLRCTTSGRRRARRRVGRRVRRASWSRSLPAGVCEHSTTSPSANSLSTCTPNSMRPGVVSSYRNTLCRVVKPASRTNCHTWSSAGPKREPMSAGVTRSRTAAMVCAPTRRESHPVVHPYSLTADRAKRGARGALYPKPTYGGLNSRPRLGLQ